MANILNSVASITNSADVFSSFANKAIVKPVDLKGIAGYVFDGIDYEEISCQSDITDHYTEDNTALHEHITRKPIILTIKGYVGEVVNGSRTVITQNGENDFQISKQNEIPYLTAINDKINLLSAYFPQYTNQTQTLYNQALQTYQTALKAKQTSEDLYNKYFKKNKIGETTTDTNIKNTNQAKVFNYFFMLWQQRRIFTVDMWLRTFENMFIQDMKPTQTDNNLMTEFSITFKQIAFVNAPTINNNVEIDKYSQQTSETNNLGKTKPIEKESLLHKAETSLGLNKIFGL